MIKHLKLTAATLALAAAILMPITSLVSAEEAAKSASTATVKEETSEYKDKAVADVKTNLNIRKSSTTNSEVIGKMQKGNMATILDKQEEWTKVKSGSVTGYVSNDYLVYEEDIEKYAEKNVKQIAKVQTETLRVREDSDSSSDIMTLVDEGDKLTAKKAEDGWVKVTTSEGKGYVSDEYVETEYQFGKAKSMKEIAEEEARKEAKKRAEEARKAALQAAASKKSSSSTTTSSGNKTTTSSSSKTSSNNAATSAGNQSSSSGTTTTTSGSSVANYALQFVGNPYKWGGTSLTNGADCSGFTLAVYAHFGYSLPHSSTSQRGSGVAVSSDNRQAGDLICYDSKDGVGHVGIYIGNNQVVHAGSSSTGIHVSTWNYRSVNCVRRIVR